MNFKGQIKHPVLFYGLSSVALNGSGETVRDGFRSMYNQIQEYNDSA